MAYTAWSVIYGETPSAAKWNLLGTNDASFNDGTGILDDAIIARHVSDGIIKNVHLDTTEGEPGGIWKDWTPTLTNLSGGAITYAKYTQIGKTVLFRFKYTLGGAGVAGAVTMTTPVDFNAGYTDARDFSCNGMSTAGGASSMLIGRWNASDKISILALTSAAAYVGVAELSATIPGTWANGNVISINGFYQGV